MATGGTTKANEIFDEFLADGINRLESPVCVARQLYAENGFEEYDVLCKVSDSISLPDQKEVLHVCLKEGFSVSTESLIFLATVIIEYDSVKVGKELLEKVNSLASCAVEPSGEESDLEKRCENLLLEVKGAIQKQQISLADLKSFFEQHKEFLGEAEACKSLDEVFSILREHTSLVNIFYLERLVLTFELHDTADLLEAHKTFIKHFCNTTSIQKACSCPLMGCFKRCFLMSHKVEFVVDWKPEEKNLSDGLALIKKTFPGMSDCVLLHSVSHTNFVSLMCFVPPRLHNALIKCIKEKEEELCGDCVISVTFGHIPVIEQKLNEKALEATVKKLKKQNDDFICGRKNTTKKVPAVAEVKEKMYLLMKHDLEKTTQEKEELQKQLCSALAKTKKHTDQVPSDEGQDEDLIGIEETQRNSNCQLHLQVCQEYHVIDRTSEYLQSGASEENAVTYAPIETVKKE